jgi:hypothetical protein
MNTRLGFSWGVAAWYAAIPKNLEADFVVGGFVLQ